MPDGSRGLSQKERQAARSRSRQLPSSLVAKEFGKVYVRDEKGRRYVEFTIKLEELSGAEAEGWQTGVALDASASMKDWYGRNLTGLIPQEIVDTYVRKGWVLDGKEDGAKVKSFKKAAYDDAIRRGFLKFTDNIVEPAARDLMAFLAGEFDADGKTTVIYWACGDGGAYEVVGDLTVEECKRLEIRGPKSVSFGLGTKLNPPLKYFIDRFVDAHRGLYVFVTDGKLDDLEDVKRTTKKLARAVEAGKRNPVKCVLIGVGENIDEDQMAQLDDLETGTAVDIWDHKVATEMRALTDITDELGEGKLLDLVATLYDASGRVIERFTDGLATSVSFVMSDTSDFFELEVRDRRIRQRVIES